MSGVEQVARAICPLIMYEFDGHRHDKPVIWERQSEKDRAKLCEIARTAIAAAEVEADQLIEIAKGWQARAEAAEKALWRARAEADSYPHNPHMACSDIRKTIDAVLTKLDPV
jgi:alpha-beta hydrolase superfamily lysophospholipase